MTVSTALNKIIYSGNSSTTVFPFSFASPAVASDIQVFFTDTFGNVTLLSPSVYTLTFNPVTGTNPTPVGGSVTYNPGGIPIPTGTFLTILRTLPLIQGTSLSNQGAFYQQVTEQTLDYEMMVSQQILEIQSRALIVNVSDPTPNPLPAVAQRAGFVLGFDVNGNPIAVSTAPAGVISGAMTPVVGAASLAAGRAAFGLGAVATEAIGLGLEDNGSGSLQTFFSNVADSGNQSVTSSFHQNIRAATGALTYTLPQTSTLFNGFGFWVYALTAAITFAINAGDAFSGAATGASLVVPPGSKVFVSTNATGTWYIRGMASPGMNAPLNLQILTSVASNALTIALKDQNGNDPSPASPVIFTVSAGGSVTPRAVTTPLSITVPSAATLGTVNGQAARIWIELFDNAGTPVLGVYNSLINNNPNFSILPWDETAQQTTTNISAGSTSAQVHYTNGALTNRNFRVIGYIEVTEATAGTWVTTPSKTQLYGPGQRKPGDVVQENPTFVSAGQTISNTTYATVTGFNLSITPTNAAHLIRLEGGTSFGQTGGGTANARWARGNTNNTGLFGFEGAAAANALAGGGTFPGFIIGYDMPNTVASQPYTLQFKTTANTCIIQANNQLVVKEIFV